MAGTGCAGRPDELFDERPEVGEYWANHFGIADRADYFGKIVAATQTPNGVFGTKLHWTAQGGIHAALRDAFRGKVEDIDNRSLDELMRARFASVRYLWLRRRNKVAQAISHYRATRSDFWKIPRGQSNRGGDRAAAVEFDVHAIGHCIRLAKEYDAQWENFFRHSRLRPLVLVYEDFVASYDRTIRGVLDFLGVSHSDLAPLDPPLERVADERSIEREKRLRDMHATQPQAGLSAVPKTTVAAGRNGGAASAPEARQARRGGWRAVSDFFAAAEEMRAGFDAHFATPHTHGEPHRVWNYWHVPDLYTYLRTTPEKILPAPLVEGFMARLSAWAQAMIGCRPSRPYLSLYVNGCRQELHNDALNGRYGYVYSLTRWGQRSFSGGETLLMRPSALDQSLAGDRAMAGQSFLRSGAGGVQPAPCLRRLHSACRAAGHRRHGPARGSYRAACAFGTIGMSGTMVSKLSLFKAKTGSSL